MSIKWLAKINADREGMLIDSALRKIESDLLDLDMEDPEALWQDLRHYLVSTLEELTPDDRNTLKQTLI